MFQELSPELFTYELYDPAGPLFDCDELLRFSVGWCDAGRLQVRPRSGQFAIMVEYPGYREMDKFWFHIDKGELDMIKEWHKGKELEE